MQANPTTTKHNKRRRPVRAALLACALSLASAGVGATGVPVVDAAHIAAQFGEFGQEAVRWGQQGQQWLKEYREWKQQYDAMFSMITNFESVVGMPQGSPMEKVAPNFNVLERCGSPYGGGTAGVIGTITGVDMRGDIHQQRWSNCANMQRARNQQYNETVDFMQDQTQAMTAELGRLYREYADRRMDQTEMQAAQVRMDKANKDAEAKRGDYEKRMAAWDRYIKAVEGNQTVLTRTIMRGNAGLIQQITTTAVMKETLCGGGQCERRDGPPVGR